MTATEAYNLRLKEYDANKKAASASCVGPATGKSRKRKDKPKTGDRTSEPFGSKILVLTATTNTNPTYNMKLDYSERYLIPSVRGPRRISLFSLRPGDWLRTNSATSEKHYDLLVVQNSNLLKKVELLWQSGNMEATPYEHLVMVGEEVYYVGRGEKRLWRKYLPRFIRRYVNTYSKP